MMTPMARETGSAFRTIPMMMAAAEGPRPKYMNMICTNTLICEPESPGTDSEMKVPTVVAKKLIYRMNRNQMATVSGLAPSMMAATIIGTMRSMAVTVRHPRREYKILV